MKKLMAQVQKRRQGYPNVSLTVPLQPDNKTPKGIMRSAVPLPCFVDVVKLQRVAGQRPRQGTKSCRMGKNSVRPSVRPYVRPSVRLYVRTSPLWLALRPCWLAPRPLQLALRPCWLALRPLQPALRPLQQALRPLQQALRPLNLALRV